MIEGLPAVSIHTHQIDQPGTDPYILSPEDIIPDNTNIPNIIVVSDRLVGFAPVGWNHRYLAGWFPVCQ